MTPSIVATGSSTATAFGNERRLFVDAYGKYLALWLSTDVPQRAVLGYATTPTGTWTANNLGSSWAIQSGTNTDGALAGAYDSTNDRLWVVISGLKVGYITFTRDGSHNITAYSVSSQLSIAPSSTYAITVVCTVLHDGTVGVLYSDTNLTNTGSLKFFRAVYANPPTYENAAGTASSIDTLSSTLTGSGFIAYPSLVERTNAGTGQYDLYAIWGYSGVRVQKAKATWSSPTWSWGATANTAPTNNSWAASAYYDSKNGLIVYVGLNGSTGITYINAGTINASDIDTNISASGLTGAARLYPSLAIDESTGNYYLFYNIGSDIYYSKYSGGSWTVTDSEIEAHSGTNPESYPSAKVDGANNAIEWIWTHYTGTAYDVYYDLIPLPVFAYGTVALTVAGAVVASQKVAGTVGIAIAGVVKISQIVSGTVRIASVGTTKVLHQVAKGMVGISIVGFAVEAFNGLIGRAGAALKQHLLGESAKKHAATGQMKNDQPGGYEA